MFAVLKEEIGLRSYREVPYAAADTKECELYRLSKEEFERLSIADGLQELPQDDLTESLIADGLLTPCEKGQLSVQEWQKPHHYENLFMPEEMLQITGHCNMNCPHCFNARDCSPLQSHLTMEQIEDILDQSKACGILGISLTGGEPLVHKDILKILSAVHDRGMHIRCINTNGYFVTEEFLAYLCDMDETPMMKISFDGIGYHSIFRATEGAEERALRAIRLSIDAGFPVWINMNVNGDNRDVIEKSLDLLDSMGVNIIRVIRTTEAPRWTKSSGHGMTVEEYFDFAVQTMAAYSRKPHHALLKFWQFGEFNPIGRTYSKRAVNACIDSSPLCRLARNLLSICANGDVYPCHQCSGLLAAAGVRMENVLKIPLTQILQKDTAYMKAIRCSVGERAEKNGICGKCEYYRSCFGGCPAIGFGESVRRGKQPSLTDVDYWNCTFYKKGYSQKLNEALAGCIDISPWPKNK